MILRTSTRARVMGFNGKLENNQRKSSDVYDITLAAELARDAARLVRLRGADAVADAVCMAVPAQVRRRKEGGASRRFRRLAGRDLPKLENARLCCAPLRCEQSCLEHASAEPWTQARAWTSTS